MVRELNPGHRLAEYDLLQPVGCGGMAEVWAARAQRSDGLVALKVVHPAFARRPEFVQMLLHEAELLTCIEHRNVVDVYGVEQADGQLFMILEWIDGDSLHALIEGAAKRAP